ncbi:S-layer homology domain-containing protein [Paenibacillus validus]|nr:S-layer homology domain-containing protein [Paenibacillus validus]
MLVCSLLLGFSGLTSAANGVKTVVSADGRAQIVLDFNDIQDAEWAAAYIAKMKSKNVVQGFEDGTFRPNQPVTRAQAIVTAVRLLGLENEAKAKSPDTKLHFKDAELIDKTFPWAKGYIIVALENGLFDASEDTVQPDKPASRVWVASLLVKALGLKEEALREMTKIPNFTDADQIPAGSIGYVNVALEKRIVSGYPDGTFQPNKNVTRAEMAALLNRTDDGLLENAGAVKISGVIQNIQFNSVTGSVYSSDTVTDSVYGSVNGEIAISTEGQDLLTYGISSELPVEYHNKFIRADQLAVNDYVHLVVLGKTVKEAVLVDQKDQKENDEQQDEEDKPTPTSEMKIHQFELEAKLSDKEKMELEYKNKGGRIEAELKIVSQKDNQKLKGQEAADAIEKLVTNAGISENMDKKEVVDKILSALNVDKDKLKELKLKIKFSSGKEVKVELEHDDGEHNDGEHDE